MFPPTTKFLVVDDHQTMRKIVKKILTGLGYTKIEEAEDGKPALEKIKSAFDSPEPFECIISDWNMPGMTGLDLLKAVRAEAKGKGLPFVLATAEGEQTNVIEAAKAGVSDYVVKPFSADTLNEKLKKAYNRHHAKAA